MLSSTVLAAFAFGALCAALVVAVVLFRRERTIRALTLKQSRAVLVGQAAEQLAAIADGFPYNAHEARFLGHPIDYVIFDGLDEDDAEVDVVFVEIKTGNARLSMREKRIRDAIESGRIRFEVVRF